MKPRTELKLVIAVALILAAVKVVYAHLVYDDWTCAIAECRKVK